MRVWFYNPYSNDNEEVLLPKLGERLKQAGFPPSTRVLIYTDLKLTPDLRTQVRTALINSNSDYENLSFYGQINDNR